MTDTPAAPSRLVASHLRDFAEFLPVEKREDFNATIDDLVDRLATAYEANTALDRALRSDTAPPDKWPATEFTAVPPDPTARCVSAALNKVVADNLPYLENLILPHGHESPLLRNHPAPCTGHDFCLMRQAQKGADAIRAALAAPVAADTKTPKSHDDLLRKKPVLIDQHGNDIYPPKLCNWIEDACRLLRGAPLLDER